MPDPAPTQAPAKAKPPGRRRPGPKAANRNKNYASENDAAGLEPSFNPKAAAGAAEGAPIGGPSTPRKKAQKNNANAAQAKSPASANQNQNQQSASASGKSGKRNKNGPKNGAANASKQQQHDGKKTPPARGTAPISLQGGAISGQDSQLSSSAPATQAFAGNSFHASPAPSALPRPAFMRGPVALAFASPESPRARPTSGLSLVQQPSPPASDSELPSATATATEQDSSRVASNNAPFLDTLFNADRAEKEKQSQARRASVSNMRGGPLQPFASPRTDTFSDNASSYTFPRDVSQQPHQLPGRRAAPSLNRSGSGISAAELDGNPGLPIGPSFATPFHERMRAVKPADIHGPQTGSPGGRMGYPNGYHGFQNAGPGQQAQTMPPHSGTPGSYLLTPPLAGPSPSSSMRSGSELEASLKRMIFNPSSASPNSAPPTMRHQPQPPPDFAGHQAAPHIVPGTIPRGAEFYANNGSPSYNTRGPLPPAQGRPAGPFDPRFEGGSPSFNGRPQIGQPYNGQLFNGQAYNGHANMDLNGPPKGVDPIWNHTNMENSLRQILRLNPDRN